MKTTAIAALCTALVLTTFSHVDAAEKAKKSALGFTVKDINGKEVNLAKKYKGKVVLVVNVASKCGLTPQYEQLQALHEKYGKKGLAIVGFPCNQFGKQEPGTEKQILEFCTDNYGVKFDLYSKINVNGKSAAPMYKYLTAQKTKPAKSGKIRWNFEKFVIGRDGNIKARFSPRTKPDAKAVITLIEAELAKK